MGMPSVSVKDVSQQAFTVALAAHFKTNVGKELAPYDEDWYFVRCASIARHIYVRSPVGVSTIRKIYGIRMSHGSSPSHWHRGAGGIARKALQSLEALKVVEKDQNGGRRLTSQGRRDLDRIAAQIKSKARADASSFAFFFSPSMKYNFHQKLDMS